MAFIWALMAFDNNDNFVESMIQILGLLFHGMRKIGTDPGLAAFCVSQSDYPSKLLPEKVQPSDGPAAARLTSDCRMMSSIR